MYKFCLFLSAGLLASAALTAGEVDVDCTMCHDSAPLAADHMPVDEVSTESCGMCHVAEAEDPYFQVIHEKHGEALGCDSCHTDASAESAARLKKMLGS